MIGQYLPNNNETATVAFAQKFCQLNSPQLNRLKKKDRSRVQNHPLFTESPAPPNPDACRLPLLPLLSFCVGAAAALRSTRCRCRRHDGKNNFSQPKAVVAPTGPSPPRRRRPPWPGPDLAEPPWPMTSSAKAAPPSCRASPVFFADHVGSSCARSNTPLRSATAPAIKGSRRPTSTPLTVCSLKYPQVSGKRQDPQHY